MRRAAALALLLALAGCESEEVDQLLAAQEQLEAQLAQEKTLAASALSLKLRLEALRRSDPLSAAPVRDLDGLAQSLAARPVPGQRAVERQGELLQLRGEGGGPGLASAVRALGERAPMLVLREVQVEGPGWTAQLAAPARAPAATPKDPDSPPPPPAPVWESARAQKLRAELARLQSELQAVDPEARAALQLARETESLRAELEHRGDLERLAQADEVIDALFLTPPAPLTAGRVRFQENELQLSSGAAPAVAARLGPGFAPLSGSTLAFRRAAPGR